MPRKRIKNKIEAPEVPMEKIDSELSKSSLEKEFDIEAAKKRILSREASRTRNNAKSESFCITSEKYAVFNEEINRRNKKGWNKRAWDNEEALEQAIAAYKAFIFDIKLYPTIEGLSLWLNITRETYYTAISLNDRRSCVLKMFKAFLDDFSAQNIISTEGNPAGNVYLDKSRLGYSDQPTEQTINVNIGTQNVADPLSLSKLVDNTPIEVDYQDVDNG